MMKTFAVLAFLATASAFTAPTMTFAVGKKKPAPKKAATKVVAKKAAPKKKIVKKAPPKKAATKKIVASNAPVFTVSPFPEEAVAKNVPTRPSEAIPGEVCPAILDGSLPGDVGFDPCFLSTKADMMASYFNNAVGGANLDGLTWYREAELMHGRICMVATVGFLWPGFFGTFAGNEWTGPDAYSTLNPLEAFGSAPSAALFQIFGFMAILEFRRIGIILSEGSKYQAGDSQKWGQGPGRWNPLGLNYTPAEYAEKQTQEIKHARLAMIGFLGMVFQANASGVSIAEQLGGAWTAPDYYAKAGYFLPEGI